MKSNFNTKYLSKGKFNYKVRAVSSVLSFSDIPKLLGTFFRLLPTIVSHSTGKVRVMPRARILAQFITYIMMVWVEHGALYTVKYMRASHVAVQHMIAGRPLNSLRAIEPDLPLPRLRTGLPVFIPVVDRRMIRQGHPGTIRLWLSLLSLYRVLKAPHKVKIETITDPFGGSYAQLGNLYGSFRHSIRLLRNTNLKTGIADPRRLTAEWLRLSTAGGPNGPIAFAQYLPDLLSLVRYPALTNAFVAYCQATGSTKILKLFMEGQHLLHNVERRESYYKDGELHMSYTKVYKIESEQTCSGEPESKLIPNDFISKPRVFDDFDTICVRGKSVLVKLTNPGTTNDLEPGKIVGIPEPAGKMRIIALVDGWTQSVFSPLHDVLFDILRTLPNDGTFDQDASFARVQRKSLESEGIYCADLSAATSASHIVAGGNPQHPIW
jgi:hypothetical protein